jgi:DNA-binding NarL/FixJ family response regulator
MIRVLIVDDHEVVRKGIRTILMSREDIEVCGEARDGREAVAKATDLAPDLIILDLTMPVMGGYETALELQGIMPEVPILFYSIHQGRQVVRQARQIGVQGFVCKTCDSETLLEAIDAEVVRKSTFFKDSME